MKAIYIFGMILASKEFDPKFYLLIGDFMAKFWVSVVFVESAGSFKSLRFLLY